MIKINKLISKYIRNRLHLGPFKPLARAISGPLRLRINDRELSFSDIGDFDFCIAPRAALPAARLSQLYLRSDAQLEAEVVGLRGLEEKMSAVLTASVHHGRSAAGALREIGTMVISKDHDWRTIFEELLRTAPRSETYVSAALQRYLEYLSQRRDAIGSLSLLKTRVSEATKSQDEISDELETQPIEPGLSARLTDEGKPAALRLPQGQPISLRLARGEALHIKLARHCFHLKHEADWALVAEDGRRYVLRHGVNSVGRSRSNTVTIDSGFKHVSRKHLLAQPVGGETIVLTDVSSCGTFVPVTALA